MWEWDQGMGNRGEKREKGEQANKINKEEEVGINKSKKFIAPLLGGEGWTWEQEESYHGNSRAPWLNTQECPIVL